MTVFFTASFQGKKKYQQEYDLILQTLATFPITVIGTEKGNYLSKLPAKFKNRFKDKNRLHYEAIRYGILHADAAIIEVTDPGLQIGYEVAIAVQAKKHVLCLSLNEDYSLKIHNEYLHGARYDRYNLARLLRNFFVSIAKEKLKNRYNMFLSDKQLAYVRERAELEEVSTSEYIRKLIEDDIRVVNTHEDD